MKLKNLKKSQLHFEQKTGYCNEPSLSTYFNKTGWKLSYNKSDKTFIFTNEDDENYDISDILSSLTKTNIGKDEHFDSNKARKILERLCKENTIQVNKDELKHRKYAADKTRVENYLVETFGNRLSLIKPGNILTLLVEDDDTSYNVRITKEQISKILITLRENVQTDFKDKDLTAMLFNLAAANPLESQLLDENITTILNKADIKTYRKQYTLGQKEEPVCNIKNCSLYLAWNSNYYGKIKYNEFDHNDYVYNINKNQWQKITNQIMSEIKANIELEFNSVQENKVVDAFNIVSTRNSFHPIKEKFDKIRGTWDGTGRVDTFFIKWLGCDDTPLNRSMSRKWLVGALHRLYDEGCNFDGMLILHGAQGCGKSTLINRIFGKEYVNNQIKVNDDELPERLASTWCVMFDELNQFKKSGVEEIKNLITTNTTHYRLKYAYRSETFDVHNVFCGATNEQYFLRDNTDPTERRMWVMECHEKMRNESWWYKNLPDSEIEQMWAEALYIYEKDKEETDPDKKFSYMLSPEEIDDLMAVQRKHKTYNYNVILKHALKKFINTDFSKELFDIYEDDVKAYIIPKNAETNIRFKITEIYPTHLLNYIFYETGAHYNINDIRPIMLEMGYDMVQCNDMSHPYYGNDIFKKK